MNEKNSGSFSFKGLLSHDALWSFLHLEEVVFFYKGEKLT
jgi:hypothetical protein